MVKMYIPILRQHFLIYIYIELHILSKLQDIRLQHFLTQASLGRLNDMRNWLQDALVVESA
jgi:hypothetical protein